MGLQRLFISINESRLATIWVRQIFLVTEYFYFTNNDLCTKIKRKVIIQILTLILVLVLPKMIWMKLLSRVSKQSSRQSMHLKFDKTLFHIVGFSPICYLLLCNQRYRCRCLNHTETKNYVTWFNNHVKTMKLKEGNVVFSSVYLSPK